MGSLLMPHVRSANELTARWCTTFGGANTAVSAAGLWPLLAVLAGAAEGPARTELAAALGVPADEAHAAGLAMLKSLDDSREVSTAIGAWAKAGLPVRPEWIASMPAGTVGELGDPAALDAWAREQTGGLIGKFPVPISPSTVFALATALLARTKWVTPFDEILWMPATGPWQGHRGTGLYRSSYPDGSVSVLGSDVTRVIVAGRGELDVHLLIGADPRHAVEAGIAALDGSLPATSDLPLGTTAPCLTVERRETADGDSVVLTLPPFDIAAHHDLLDHAALFGLSAASDSSRGHFPGISSFPLAVEAAAQNVIARFDAAGFEAAAVTAAAVTLGWMPQLEWATITSVNIDRPFGFLAVDRPTGLVLVAGQVTTPPLTWERPAGEDPRPPGSAPW
ncbi:serpin family protein [Nocardia rosealba]|uniref:serpin family protein n=1 Tax=Nocardia rosealba TaxID=2878563 RepID=UPI001CD94448|nr:serpin family protein [Nocardia rosealba]MCA2208496.1 serpin family protein [Nocardia rosealba]